MKDNKLTKKIVMRSEKELNEQVEDIKKVNQEELKLDVKDFNNNVTEWEDLVPKISKVMVATVALLAASVKNNMAE